MPNFPPSHTPFPGLPAGFLSQAEAPFGGSLEDAVARLQDGSLPAADVESLRNLFASLLTTAGHGADSGGSARQAFASAATGVAELDVAGEDSPSLPWFADELPADLLAALGLPPGGQNLPDALPGAASHGLPDTAAAADPAGITNTGQPMAFGSVVPSGDDAIPFGVSAGVASPEAAIADDALFALSEGEAADASAGAGTATGSNGEATVDAATTTSAAAQVAAAAGIADAGTDIPEAGDGGAAGIARAAIGSGPDPAAGMAGTGMLEPAVDAAHSARAARAGNADVPATAAAESAAVQRLAALLAEMEPASAVEGAASDEAWLREAMQRIDAALQSLRAGGGEMTLSRPEQGSSTLPAGFEALAARLLAAGDDAGKRLAVLQEARHPAPGAEGVAAAAPTAPNPGAVSAAGVERAQPTLPLGLALQHERWGEEVGERVRWMIGQQIQSAEIKITPQHLGTIEVRISMHKEQMQISFVSPHAAVREVLEDAAPRLREMMSAAGYAAVDVDVSHQEPSRQHDGGSRQWAGVGATPWGGEDGEVHESVGTIAPRSSGVLDCYA